MKGLIILANGFEDSEAITTFDVLKRSGIEMVSATPNGNLEVTTQCHHKIKAHITLADINTLEYDFLVLPGGGAVSSVLNKLTEVDDLITQFIKEKKLVAAICAAPSLVGKSGHYNGFNFTCFPGFNSFIKGGNHQDLPVVVSGQFITAKSMFYTIDFALAIIEKMQGKTQCDKVLRSLKGE